MFRCSNKKKKIFLENAFEQKKKKPRLKNLALDQH